MSGLLAGTESITIVKPSYGSEDEYGERALTGTTSTTVNGVLVGISGGDLERGIQEQEGLKKKVTCYAPRGAWLQDIVPGTVVNVRGERYILSEPPHVWQAPAGFRLVTPRVVLNLVRDVGGV